MEKREYRRRPHVEKAIHRGEVRYVLFIPGASSETGKLKRRYFRTEREAYKELKNLDAAITTRGKQAAAAPAALVTHSRAGIRPSI